MPKTTMESRLSDAIQKLEANVKYRVANSYWFHEIKQVAEDAGLTEDQWIQLEAELRSIRNLRGRRRKP